MRYFSLFIPWLFLVSCMSPKVTFKNNHQITTFDSTVTITQPLKSNLSDQSLESDQSEYPLYALLEVDSTSEFTSNLGLEKRNSKDEKISQRIKELKIQLNASPDYSIPSDTLKSAADQNFNEAKLYGSISFALSILSTILIVNLIGAVFLPALVLAVMSLKRYRHTDNKKFKIFPIISLVISGVGTVFLTSILVLLIIRLSQGEILAP